MDRRAYEVTLRINGRSLKTLVIDPHYEARHCDSVDDATILQLVQMLDNGIYQSESVDSEGFEYYVEDHMNLNGKLYKLIWLLHDDEIFVGVVNCYRRD